MPRRFASTFTLFLLEFVLHPFIWCRGNPGLLYSVVRFAEFCVQQKIFAWEEVNQFYSTLRLLSSCLLLFMIPIPFMINPLWQELKIIDIVFAFFCWCCLPSLLTGALTLGGAIDTASNEPVLLLARCCRPIRERSRWTSAPYQKYNMYDGLPPLRIAARLLSAVTRTNIAAAAGDRRQIVVCQWFVLTGNLIMLLISASSHRSIRFLLVHLFLLVPQLPSSYCLFAPRNF